MTDSVARAGRAQQLVDDPLLTEILDAIEGAAINAWSSTSMSDREGREIAYHALRASRRVREALKGVIDNGLIEARRAVRP